MSPTHCDFALEKYFLLQEQHQELSSHLQQIRPSQRSVSSTSSRSSCSSYSPPQSRHSRSSGRQHTRARARCSGWSKAPVADLDTIVDEETIYEISAEEQRLLDLNESIKRALTELLNTDAVRGDHSMRMWAQARLMETEKELRSGRRRRGSPDW